MKKLTLFAVVALLAAGALPAMATDFSWSGEITFGFTTDFSGHSDNHLTNAYLNLTAKVNDNFSVLSGIYFNPNSTAAAVPEALTNIGDYYATADLGKALSLPVGEVMTIGWIDTTATGYAVSGYAYESLVLDPGVRYNVQSVTTFDKINVQVSMDPASWFGTTPANYLLDIYGPLGPISFSAAYSSAALGTGKGLIFGDVQFAQAMDPISFAADVQVKYDLNASAYTLGVGGKFAYSTMVTVGVGTSFSTAGLGNLGINVNYVNNPKFGADLGVSLDLATGAANLINNIDGSLWTKIDVSTLRVGYDYTMNATGYEAPIDLTNGGVYFSYDITF
jgi:hypothetical protein